MKGHLTKRLTRAVLAALIALPILAVGTASATYTSCMNASYHNTWNGNNIYSEYSSPEPWNYKFVEADIDPTLAGFKPCGGGSGTITSADAALAWVALVPNPFSHDGASNTSTILQIGIINCNDASFTSPDPCSGTGLHYFWSRGGCGATPEPIDLGAGDTASHNYEIRWIDGVYILYIDGSVKASINQANSLISCWAQDDVSVQVSGEKWDGGDSYADPSDHLNITNIGFRSESDGYSTIRQPCRHCSLSTSTAWTGSTACSFSDNGEGDINHSPTWDDKCDIVNADSFDIWSTAP